MTQPDRRRSERRIQPMHVDIERRHTDRRRQQRRHDARIPLELWVEEITHDEICSRHTADISLGGVYLDQAHPYALGTHITLKFSLPGDQEMIVARGEVVSGPHEDTRMGMGIKFISIEGSGSARLHAFLGEMH